MRRVAAILSSLFACLIGLASDARANPLDSFGYGSRSTALAGAVTADVEDLSANYYNPAGLVRGEGLRLELGYMRALHSLEVDGRDNDVDPLGGILGGIVAPGRAGPLRFALGIGLHLNDERISRTRSLPQNQPRWELYDNRTHRIFLAAHLAIQPFRWLSIGGGISFMAATRGGVEIAGDVSLLRPDDETALRHRVDSDLTSVRYPQLGIQITPDHHWSFGIAYRGEFRLRLELEATLAGDIVAGRADNPSATRIPGYFHLVSDSVNAFLPQQVAFGVSWRPTTRLRIGLDVTWVDWSAYRNPTALTEVELRIDVPPGFPGIEVPAGVRGTTPLPPRFVDRVVPRVGVEVRVLDLPNVALDARGGYVFEASPAPDQDGDTNFMDSDRHVLALGIGLLLRRPAAWLGADLAIDVHLQHFVFDERLIRKASPIDPVGDYRIDGSIWSFGGTTSLVF